MGGIGRRSDSYAHLRKRGTDGHINPTYRRVDATAACIRGMGLGTTQRESDEMGGK